MLDSHLDDMDADHSHYKPEAIDTLCQLTKFNKRELQLMYRGFKQVRILHRLMLIFSLQTVENLVTISIF